MTGLKYSGAGFGTKELYAEQKPGLSFLGHFGISPTAESITSFFSYCSNKIAIAYIIFLSLSSRR
jgi:hypothetical protein